MKRLPDSGGRGREIRMKALLIAMMALLATPSLSWAGRAEHFKGWYEILAGAQQEDPQQPQRQFMLLDNDTLANIWARYSKDPLPENLQEIKEEPTIIVAFTDRNVLFLTLERGSTIGPDFLSISGAGTNQLEMKRAADGSYDMAMIVAGELHRTKLAAPVADPDAN